MRLLRGLCPLAMTVMAACGPGRAKSPPFEVLSLPADTIVAPWSNLPSAAWLGGGRWVLVAGDWDAVAVADFQQKTLTPLGGPKQQAYLHPAAVFSVGETLRFERQIFSGDDLWGVWRDGTVWIARLLRNQIESIDPGGKVTRGPELPDPVFEVTQADRLRYLQGFPSDVRPNEGDLPWALIHPPFVAAFGAPGERIWLEKSKPVLDTARSIQVVDRRGDLLRILWLPGDARLLGVGWDAALFAEQFEKGVRLMLVRIPAPPPP